MDQLKIDKIAGDKILKWVKDNYNSVVGSSLLTDQTPLPFTEILIGHEEKNPQKTSKREFVEVILKGKSFNDMTLTLLNDQKRRILSVELTNFSKKLDESGRLEMAHDYKIEYHLAPHLIEKLKATYGFDIFNLMIYQSVKFHVKLMIYLMFHKENLVKERKVIQNPHKQNKQKKAGSKKRRVYIEHHYKLIGVEQTDRVKMKRHMTAESWNVRGHMRRYKNGKIIFVKPYVKGAGASRIEKEYRM